MTRRRWYGAEQLALNLPAVHDGADAPWEAPVLETRGASRIELLTRILGPSTHDACASVLEEHRDLRTVARLFPADLRACGFNRAHVEKLVALFEFARRFGEEQWVEGTVFRTSYDVYAHFRERLADALVEYFIIVLLDVKNHKLKDIVISQGSLTSSVVHPREVFLPAIRNSAAGVILVHNHPSGIPEPSPEDIMLTRRLRDVGDLIGIRVLDHIIIGKGRYVSLVDDGMW